MPSYASVAAYLAAQPDDRRAILTRVREVVNQHLPAGYEEGIQYGMIAWYVPHSRYPAGYHCKPTEPLPFMQLASQKSHLSMYLMGIYGSPELRGWFEKAWVKAGKKLDAGKACVRFKKLDDLALDVLGELLGKLPVDEYIRHYETALGGARKAATKKPAAKKPATKKAATKKRAATR